MNYELKIQEAEELEAEMATMKAVQVFGEEALELLFEIYPLKTREYQRILEEKEEYWAGYWPKKLYRPEFVFAESESPPRSGVSRHRIRPLAT